MLNKKHMQDVQSKELIWRGPSHSPEDLNAELWKLSQCKTIKGIGHLSGPNEVPLIELQSNTGPKMIALLILLGCLRSGESRILSRHSGMLEII